MIRKFVKPGEGRKVLNEETQRPIRKNGEWINDSAQVQKWLKIGDLVPAVPREKGAKAAQAADEPAATKAETAPKIRAKKSKTH